jgi:hypothetical protein
MLIAALLKTIIRGKQNIKIKRMLSKTKFEVCLFMVYLYDIFNFDYTGLK